MADPKILYWVSGIVVCLMALWVAFVNVRLESRTAPSAPPKPKKKETPAKKKEEKKDEKTDEKDDD